MYDFVRNGSPLATNITHLHPASVAEAKAVQEKLRHEVSLRDGLEGAPRLIAGIDVGYDKKRNLSKAVAVLMAGSPPELIASAVAMQETPFPYVPGLLSFREVPAILDALQLLPERPDLLLVDGHGIAHPRRIGIASHIGVLTGIPAIGVAKKRLTGAHEEPGRKRGACAPLMDGDEQIGTVLRSRDNVKPLYISPGHKVNHETACHLAGIYLAGYRLPEPTRLADKLSKFN